MTDSSFHHDEKGGRYVCRLPDGDEAVLSYEVVDPSVIDLQRTYVPESHRGAGVGRKLVRHVLAQAEARGMKVIPTCPFVSRVVAESPDYRELVVGERARA